MNWQRVYPFWIVILFVFSGISSLDAQRIAVVETKFSNTFREWMLYSADEDIRGDLRMRWAMRNDWTAWDLQFGDLYASIEQKWEEDPNLWVIQCKGVTVNAKTAWRGDFTRWKLNDGNQQINWQPRYSNQRDEWEMDTQQSKAFTMFTSWSGDFRRWEVADELPDEYSDAMRVAMIFLALHFSTPRI